jgi:DNA polymerase III subunit delta
MADPLRSIVDQGARGGVFFLYGEDQHRKEEAARALVDAHLDAATRDFNYDVLSGSEVEVESFASILATPPMMAEWRVVLVQDAEAFAASPTMRTLALETAESPPPDLLLILVARIPEGSKAKFYKDLSRHANAVEFKAMSPDDVPGWLMAQAEERLDKPITPEAARALAAALGTDLGILSKELDKLAEVAGEDLEITLATVEVAGTRLPKQDRWEWFDMVGERRFGEAIEGLGVLLGQGESGVGLTVGLATHLLRLGVVVEDGTAALEPVLPRHQKWLARRLQGQAKRWSSDELDRALLGLRRVDRLLKASPLSDEHHMEEWFLALMTRQQVAA